MVVNQDPAPLPRLPARRIAATPYTYGYATAFGGAAFPLPHLPAAARRCSTCTTFRLPRTTACACCRAEPAAAHHTLPAATPACVTGLPLRRTGAARWRAMRRACRAPSTPRFTSSRFTAACALPFLDLFVYRYCRFAPGALPYAAACLTAERMVAFTVRATTRWLPPHAYARRLATTPGAFSAAAPTRFARLFTTAPAGLPRFLHAPAGLPAAAAQRLSALPTIPQAGSPHTAGAPLPTLGSLFGAHHPSTHSSFCHLPGCRHPTLPYLPTGCLQYWDYSVVHLDPSSTCTFLRIPHWLPAANITHGHTHTHTFGDSILHTHSPPPHSGDQGSPIIV